MSHPFFARSVFLTVSASALALGCAGDQTTTETPADRAASEVPTEQVTPRPASANEPLPSGDPVGSLPPTPPPRGLNGANVLAAPPAAEPAPRISEAQIAKIVELANNAEIEQGKLAKNKAKSASVKEFAAMMVKHHTEAKADQAKLVKQLQLTPTQSQEATALKSDADKTLGALRAASGNDFDVQYINSQVDAHQQVLDSIDRQLLPSAQNEDYVAGLKELRQTVASHLDEAKSLQAELNKSP